MFFYERLGRGVAFLLVTFLWPRKEKLLAGKAKSNLQVYH
jgi:hypothetical protein